MYVRGFLDGHRYMEEKMWNDFIKYVIDIGYVLCSSGIFGFVFKGLNEEKIKASICKKVEKEFR